MVAVTQWLQFLTDIHDSINTVVSDRIQDVDTVHTDVWTWFLETNQSIVQEHIKPLLIECLLLSNHMCEATIESVLLPLNLCFLEVLDHFDSQSKIVTWVSIDEFTHEWPFGRIFLDDTHIVADEKFIFWSITILSDLSCQCFTELHCWVECTTWHWVETSQQHGQIDAEYG